MSKNVGITKEIDNLGRIVIPKEFRNRLGLEREVEVILMREGVLIRNSKYELVMKEKEVGVK
ncbi:MAG: AbrB/MazE/SpoVT family DNA-binding domain-containing protein [Clostridia bacterium]|nr:AbrB/MazE/SpoVT family DNA-binding domain-containing protein [Clostridia bacterium]